MTGEDQPALQWLLDRCASQFVEGGTWPETRQVLRDAARAGVELDSFFYDPVPREFVYRRDHNGVVLSALGLARTAAGQPLVASLAAFARLCADQYLGDDDHPQVTADMLRERLGMDDVTVDRVYKLFMGTEYFLTAGGGGTDTTHWHYDPNDLVRKFQRVQTSEQYLQVRHAILSPQQPLPAATLPPEFLVGTPEGHAEGEPEPPEERPADEGNPESEPPVAFVSWAHSDDAWEAAVLGFANVLRAEGIDAHVDLYDRHKAVDWQLYGTKWIERADFVLIVTSAAYKERWGMESPAGTGAGVAREAVTLRGLFDDDRDNFLRKVRVILLAGVEPSTIPQDISYLAWVRVSELTAEGVDDVIRHMTSEDAYPMPELGNRRTRGPKPPNPSPGVEAAVQPDPLTSGPLQKPSPSAGPTLQPVPLPSAPEAAEVAAGDPDIGTGGVPGMVELRVPLRGEVTSDWTRCFSSVSSSKEGSLNLVMSDPNVRHGKVIWRVEERDLESAMRHITRRIRSANMLLEQERGRQAERERQLQAEEERKHVRWEELKERVRGKSEPSS